MMQAKQRIELIRLYQKLENNPSYSDKLGIKIDFRCKGANELIKTKKLNQKTKEEYI